MHNYLFFRYHYAILSKEERLKTLKDQYYFDCQCTACTENYPLYFSLPHIEEYPLTTVPKEAYQKLESHDREFALQKLYVYLNQLSVVSNLSPYPSKQLCDLQEAAKQCLAILTKEVY